MPPAPPPGRLPRIRSCQIGLRNPTLVDQIKADMRNGRFAFSEPRGQIGGWIDANGIFYVNDGNHRMAAALEIFREDGDSTHVLQLIRLGALDPNGRTAAGSSSHAGSNLVGIASKLARDLIEAPMSEPRLRCLGVGTDSLRLPAFELSAGQRIDLRLPAPLVWKQRDALIDLLTGKVGSNQVRIKGRALWAEPPQIASGLLAPLRSATARDWLATAGALSPEASMQQITRWQVCEPNERVCRLAMNPRVLLAILAAWGKGAEVLIYSTTGCDPMGKKKIHETVGARTDVCPAIHLSYPAVSNGIESFDSVPEAVIVEAHRISNGIEVVIGARHAS